MALNQSSTAAVFFHWFSALTDSSFVSDDGVDVVQYLFANDAQFAFRRVNQAA